MIELKCRTYYDGGTRYAAYRIRPASAPNARRLLDERTVLTA